MKKSNIYSEICLFISVLLFSTVVFSQERIFQKPVSQSVQWYKPGELIVKFKAETSEKIVEEINLEHGASQVYKSRPLGFRKLRVSKEKNVFELAETYSKNPNVEYAQPNYICRAFFIPNDPYYSYQWHFPLINMEQAWDIETGELSVVVAVLDTGVAYEDYRRGRRRRYYLAPDLAGTNFVQGYDFIENDTHPNDDEGHGTHITGTIAQTTDNGIGVAGIAFNCSIMPVKVLDRNGSGTVDSLAEGMTYAADNGARVINMSLGFSSDVTPGDVPALTEAVEYAYNVKGCILVASSGNEGVGIVSLPAAYPEVVAVGAAHSGDARADYSQYGPELELVAPGGDDEDRDDDGYIDGVLQQTFGNNTSDWGYWFYTGTSCSAPHVSAVAALVLSQNPALSNEEVREVMRSTAVDLGPAGRDDEYGYGRIDACAALLGEIIPNEPPVISGLPDQVLDEDTSVDDAFNLDDYASDPDAGDTISYSIVGNTEPDCGVSIDAGGNIDISPTADWNGQSEVTVQVSDGKATDTDTFIITVRAVNDPPKITSTPVTTATQDVLYIYDVQATDVDAADDLTYSLAVGPSGMNIDSATGLIQWTPTSAQLGDNSVEVSVTDIDGASDTQTFVISVSEASSEITVFSDSFEVSEWNGLWTEDSQKDWFRSRQRAVDGRYSAEVDGRASDAELISVPIDLQGKTNATITFSWYIERSLDRGEYLAFDVSTDGGANWIEKARLRGNVDSEKTWHNVSTDLTGINSLRIRFRGTMSQSGEDADVDMVEVIAW